MLIKFSIFFTMIVFYFVNMVVIILADPDSDTWPGQEKSFACIPDIVNQTQLYWIHFNQTQSNSIKLSPWVKFDWVQQSNQIELTQKYEDLSCFSINTFFVTTDILKKWLQMLCGLWTLNALLKAIADLMWRREKNLKFQRK